ISAELNAKGARLLPLMGRTTPQSTALEAEIRTLENQYCDVEADIQRTSPQYAALTQPSPLMLDRIQRDLLDNDTLLVEYSLGAERSYLWVAGKSQLNAWELPARAVIEAQVDRVMALIGARGASVAFETPTQRNERIRQADADLPEAARALSAMVIGPAASVIGGKRLAIVPDGA